MARLNYREKHLKCDGNVEGALFAVFVAALPMEEANTRLENRQSRCPSGQIWSCYGPICHGQ